MSNNFKMAISQAISMVGVMLLYASTKLWLNIIASFIMFIGFLIGHIIVGDLQYKENKPLDKN